MFRLINQGVDSITSSMSTDGAFLSMIKEGDNKYYLFKRGLCDKTCLTCDGPNNDDCLKCLDGSTVASAPGTCLPGIATPNCLMKVM